MRLTLKYCSMFILGIFLFLDSTAIAQTTNGTMRGGRQNERQGNGRQNGARQGAQNESQNSDNMSIEAISRQESQRIQRVVTDLTPAQITQVNAATLEFATTMKARRDHAATTATPTAPTEADRAAMREQMQVARQNLTQSLKSILTDAQFQTFTQATQMQGGRHGNGNGNENGNGRGKGKTNRNGNRNGN